jgi:CheY-like chemotaxis protein
LQPGKRSVAITGYGMDEDIRRCREAGFDDHLTKPVNFARLEALIHSLAQKPASE